MCALSAVSLVIHAPPPSSTPLERYVFSTAAFPSVPSSELLTSFTGNPPPVSDLPEQFRATIARLSTLSSSLSPLPPDCSFNLMMELRDDAGVEPPLGPTTPWIAAEPGLQKQKKTNADSSNEIEAQGRSKMGKDLGGAKATPVRNVESGAFALEMWIEEGQGKFDEQPG
ncbi:MAG: hypothetical protein L6R35_002876 [Caloplaca aegaea]|nr:MAG: hypothetical protein L6R35_002876 [Caloplaca aegaea]